MSRFRCTRTLALLSTFSAVLAAGAVPAVAQVEVSAAPLPAPDLWSTPGRETGLPADLWSGTSADLARAALPKLGTEPIGPALRRLAIRVLATGAAAPAGGAEDAALAAERAMALTRLGAPDAALGVLSRTPRVEASEPLSRARAEAALYLGDPRACETERALQTGRGGAFWLKLRAFCQLQAGDGAAAQVTFDLWRQTGDRAPAYTAGMTQALGGGRWSPVLADALTTALSRRHFVDLSEGIDTASPAAVAALARAPEPARAESDGPAGTQTIPPPVELVAATRLKAAERAVQLGLMSAAEAEAQRSGAALAADARPGPGERSSDPVDWTALDTAALLQAAAVQSPPDADARARLATSPSPAPTARAGALLALLDAAEAKRPGETALLALLVASETGKAARPGAPATSQPADRALIVRALARAGFEAEARALAAEAAPAS